MIIRRLLLLATLFWLLPPVSAAETTYLYKATLVQAAPGSLLELIDLYKDSLAGYRAADDELPLWMRHSQGDHWDLLLLMPMRSYTEYSKPERIAQRAPLRAPAARIDQNIARQEDLFVYGPPVNELRRPFASASFFHVEMFHAIAGKQSELLKEREMENIYHKTLKRPENFIFVRDQGARLGSVHNRRLSRPKTLCRKRRHSEAGTGSGGLRGCK